MRSMSNRIFVDSSVLIEYYKGANTLFWEALFAGTEIRLFINQIVVSPRTLQIAPDQSNCKFRSRRL